MKKVLCIGAATVDIVAIIPNEDIEKISFSNDSLSFLMLERGGKLELNSGDMHFGGDAVNVALSMQKLGVSVDCITKIGNDKYGSEIKKYLKNNEIGAQHVISSDVHSTAISIIISSHDGDSTILTHRGANATIDSTEVDFSNIKNYDAIYIANLSGKSVDLFDDLINTAYVNNVKIISNPGIKQIINSTKDLLDSIAKITMFIVNRVEAEELLKLLVSEGIFTTHSGLEKNELTLGSNRTIVSIKSFVQYFTQLGVKVAVVTDGKNGSYMYAEDVFHHVPAQNVDPVATVGAGDAFNSTLATLWLSGTPIETAAHCASKNAASVVCALDAHTNLLCYDELL